MQNQPTRNRKKIKAWMIQKNITGSSIAKQLQLSNAIVSATIAGFRNNRKVLKSLVASGCPNHFLALPNDMIQLNLPTKEIPFSKKQNPAKQT
ncbi:MAG: hypothetical protein HQL55_12715 [Magnetococcales bacterium]|nr:hypothetical protein [Magnetococcales bacterium]